LGLLCAPISAISILIITSLKRSLSQFGWHDGFAPDPKCGGSSFEGVRQNILFGHGGQRGLKCPHQILFLQHNTWGQKFRCDDPAQAHIELEANLNDPLLAGRQGESQSARAFRLEG
jgi:hypothetical protein